MVSSLEFRKLKRIKAPNAGLLKPEQLTDFTSISTPEIRSIGGPKPILLPNCTE
jgi:hypothetical protein